MSMRKHQTGLTMITWIILIAMIGFIGIFGFKRMPIYLEYNSINNSLTTVSKQVTSGETPAQIRSVMKVQEATATALLIDADALAPAQRAGDVLGANAAMMDAYSTDVRPLLGELREETGLDPDPVTAYARSGYGEKIMAERVGGTPASWGS